MSTNVYLKNEVRDLPGFKTERYSDNSGDKVQLDGMSLSSDKGRIYLIIGDIDSSIPEKLKDLIDEITHYEWIPRMGHREAGVYRLESAECDLVPKDPGGKRENPQYWLKMKATKLEDMQNLLHRIKIGTIRPEESYEGAQNGLSRKELEGIALQRDRLLNQLNSTHSEVVRLTRELEDVHDRCDRLAKDINSATGKKALLRQLIDELLGKSADGSISCWPLVSRRGVVEKITTILDDTE